MKRRDAPSRPHPRATKSQPRATKKKNDGPALAQPWQAWVAENAIRGISAASLVETLVNQGVDAKLASREVSAIVGSPALLGAHPLAEHARRLELVIAARRALAELGPEPRGVERRDALGRDEFFDRYYASNTPVVIENALRGWKALTKWTPSYFRRRFGDVAVEIAADRDRDPDCDLRLAEHAKKVTMRAFADRLARAGETNDFYMVANNRNLERGELAPLLDDIAIVPEYLDATRIAGCVCLWVGPKGTVTPLHHDTTNILFCQVRGRKRVRMISPLETSMLAATRGVYSAIDLESPDHARFPGFKDVVVRDVTLEAGEALFIPVGWWHHVRSLAVSINVSFTNFLRPNSFDWYRPGEPARR